MRLATTICSGLSACALAVMAMATVPAAAQQQQKRPNQAAGASGSWCATYPGQGISENCSYSSLNQCNQTVLGRGGFCQPNPFPGTPFGSGYTWSGPGVR